MPPHPSCCYRCPICSRGVVGTREAVITIGIVLRFRGNVLVSEQANNGCADGFGVRLIGCADDAALPIGMHDYAEALGCCMLVDKTMFIADVLDCDASVVVCCRPEGFGKSMNLSMLKAFLERPAIGRSGQRLFADAQIWDADGGRYRDEYACYPVISLDFSGAARRGAAIADVVRDALSGECARLLASKLRGMLCHVNLIPVNEVEESPFKPSSPERIERFTEILAGSGITATVRRKLGSDIEASCGQLRRKMNKKGDKSK